MRAALARVRMASGYAAVALFAAAVTGYAQPDERSACELEAQEQQWIEQALAGWTRVRNEVLRLDPAPVPWLMLFDERCVWHLSPDVARLAAAATPTTPLTIPTGSVSLYTMPHDGQIRLPNDTVVDARATASTSVYGSGLGTFSLISMYGVWQRDPRHARDPQLSEFFQGLVIHELTHSTQLVRALARVSAVRRAHAIPVVIDDDVVQRRFGSVGPFKAAIDAEREMFYQAALTTDHSKQRALAAKALSMARKRRARFYVAHLSAFKELEDVFFAMEGSAQWATYRWARWQAPPEVGDDEIIGVVRADRKYWSQDEGLALYLLIDALLPGWQQRTFGGTLESPFALLEEALK